MAVGKPALATVGLACLTIVTSAETGVQLPLLTVQRNTFVPIERLLTVEDAEVGFTTEAVPLMTVHAPVSPLATTGVEPVIVPVVAQVGVKPALAVTPVGAVTRVIVIVLTLFAQGALTIVHVSVVVPVGKLLMDEVPKLGLPKVT
ncbi:MAG: hypothetical protein EAY75_05730, partial [Bacteroidetes bacterium]